MRGFLKIRWVLFLVLCVFALCKIPHLSYPYYWDESWPYAAAVKAMFDNGLSLLPNAIDTELSRGHPLFFHVLVGGWMRVFGTSHVAVHSFSLSVSLLFLVAIFEVGVRLFNQRVATMALLLAATLEAFFVQSSFILPEMLVAFLCFLSLYFYVKSRFVYTAICLSALFLCKESGMIMGAILGVDAVVRIFYKSGDRKGSVLRLVSIAVPCVLIGLFFLIQKQVNGWYIFPLHADSIEHDWQSFWVRFRMLVVSDTYCRNLRFYYFLLLLFIGIIASIKIKNIRFAILALPAAFVYYFVDDMRAGRILPSVPFFILFVIVWFWCAWVVTRKEMFVSSTQRHFIFLALCFVLCYQCFCASNFYVYRYQLASVVMSLFVLAALYDVYVRRSFGFLYPVSLAAFLVLGYVSFNSHEGTIADTDTDAFIAMDVEQNVVDYREEKAYYDKNITCGAYLERAHLTNLATGFLKHQRVFSHVKWDIEGNTDIIIFNNIEADYRYERKNEWQNFELIHRIQKGSVWAEVYKRID